MLSLKSTRTSQPQGRSEIDWDNPLTHGLVAAGNYTAPEIEQVTSKLVVNSRSKTLGPAGEGVGGTSGLITYESTPEIVSATGYPNNRTILFVLSTTTTLNTVIAEKGNNQNIVCQTIYSKFSYRNVEQSSYDARTLSDITSGNPVVVAGVTENSLNKVYFNGVLEASKTTIQDSANNYPLVVGARAGNLYPFQGTIYLMLLFARALSDSEIASLSANPWQVFK